jgi:predicted transcriptional regulator
MDTPDNPDLRPMRGANYDEWFLREVDKGIAAADGGKLVEHSDVRNLIDERYPG